MNNKNTIQQSILVLSLVLGLTFGAFANAQGSIAGSIKNILNEISALADEFNLTNKQKAQMRVIVMDYLPSLALKSSAMINNRQKLLESTISNDVLDENYLQETANKQGELLVDLIVMKEHLKKDLRFVLTEDQKEFVDEFIQTIIQRRLES